MKFITLILPILSAAAFVSSAPDCALKCVKVQGDQTCEEMGPPEERDLHSAIKCRCAQESYFTNGYKCISDNGCSHDEKKVVVDYIARMCDEYGDRRITPDEVDKWTGGEFSDWEYDYDD